MDNLAPPLDPVNFNVFGRLFGVSFIADDVSYIRSISPFEYVRCYQLDDNLTKIISEEKQYLDLLHNGVPGFSSTEIITALHFRMQ